MDRLLWGSPLLLLMLSTAACGGDDDNTSSSGAGFFSPGSSETGGGTSGGSGGASAGAGNGDSLPPEREVESDYEAPVATGRVVWIANPKSGRVALVDAQSLHVRTVEAGNAPTYLASVPGQMVDTTLVLNVLSADATLLRATTSGGKIETKTFKTAQQANSSTFSSDGRWAIIWADARKVANAPKQMGFQDIAVLDLQSGASTILAVGYRPVAVGFAAGNTQAYAVTQDGVAIVGIGDKPAVLKNVAIADSPTEDPGTRDVFVTKDGARAFIRRDGSAKITIVALGNEQRSEIELSGPVTDLDLADTGDRAVAVVRSTAEVSVVPIANPSDNASITVTGETIGSVSIAPGGNRALLYTNAKESERFTVLDLGTTPGGGSTFRTVRLYAPVLGIFSAPDAQHGVVLHDGTPGAFSVVPLGQNLPAKIVPTLAKPTSVAMLNDRAIIAERDDQKQIFGAYLARMPQLMVERYPLASPPIAVGAVPDARRVFVAQQHPEGRLTFIDLESGVARTLTGFELSSRVVDGSAAK